MALLMNERLSKSNIKSGQRLALKNAVALYDTSKYLFKKKTYNISFSLIILAHEELGKIFILPGLYSEDQKKRKELWTQFYKHEGKLEQLIANVIAVGEIVKAGKFKPETVKEHLSKEFNTYFDMAVKVSRKMNKYKKLGFYLDYKNGSFHLPGDSLNHDDIYLLSGTIKQFPFLIRHAESFSKLDLYAS